MASHKLAKLKAMIVIKTDCISHKSVIYRVQKIITLISYAVEILPVRLLFNPTDLKFVNS